MDTKRGLGIRNWDFSDQKPLSGTPVPGGTTEHESNFLKMSPYPGRNYMFSQAEAEASSMEFVGNYWGHSREYHPNTKTSPYPLQPTPISMELPTDLNDEEVLNVELGTKSKNTKKEAKKSNRVASKALRPKLPRKKPDASKKKEKTSEKREKKSLDFVFDGTSFDLSQIPTPSCSCTGVLRQCYRWGAGGWQSSCCTISISEHPLPMSSSRPGARLAGRKMSNGAYGKLLQRLAAEGYDLSNAIDLKDHWAKHGTNKFVTIK
ncbi:hypothetical protein GIB67_028164 [Kingdonia uniflora]|uniref:GAGA-binding transcriptional activator n=1 Tax=Kingdonia uniflora TaxID=39325 RepID=A0A7J7KZN9_9MAGN|nr:hypothetical protein GIB67_028164 [Kingdonia uniflora]